MHPRSDVQTLELKIPPVALVIIAALLMWLGHASLPEFKFHFQFQTFAAWAVGLLGVLACLLGVVEFRRSKTTVNPNQTTVRVVIGQNRHLQAHSQPYVFGIPFDFDWLGHRDG